MASGNESKFSFFAHFLNREFIGQKALNEDNERIVAGETMEEIFEQLWSAAIQYIKREVIVDGDNFTWAEKEKPERSEIEKFIVLQDQTSKKTIPVVQVNLECLRKIRGKHVNIFVYTYGKVICNKAMHTKFSAKLLIPEIRDRANADSTTSVMALVKQLKDIHETHYSAIDSCWVMWANYIHCAPPNESKDALKNKGPPAHLVKLFSSVAFSDNERLQSAQNGLQITDNMIDAFKNQLKLFKEDYQSMLESFACTTELMQLRIAAMEGVLDSTQTLVSSITSALKPQENEVSVLQESLIMDCDDVDHDN